MTLAHVCCKHDNEIKEYIPAESEVKEAYDNYFMATYNSLTMTVNCMQSHRYNAWNMLLVITLSSTSEYVHTTHMEVLVMTDGQFSP